MAWSPLATQFCLELGFGVLLTLALIPRAPMGVFFFRMMGTTALVPILAAGLLGATFGGMGFQDPGVIAALLACVAFPWYSGPVRGERRFTALAFAAVCTAVALWFTVVSAAPGLEAGAPRIVGVLSALAAGVVAGGVGTAMVVGHWYLTVPSLPVSLLARVNRATLWAMGASSVLVLSLILMHAEALEVADTPLLSPYGLFHLGARLAVGLLLPLLFGWMTGGALRYQNTRSATGILYASTVLVLIGAAGSLSLQDSYGIPL